MSQRNRVNPNSKDNDSFYLRQNELAQKNIKLKVLKDLSDNSDALVEQKRESLTLEISALNELHHKVWFFQDRTCDEAWNFSKKHDLYGVLNNFPKFPSKLSCSCECALEIQENLEEKSILSEIEKLESDLENENAYLLQRDLVRAELEFMKCKEKSPENLRLENDIKASKERILSLKEKIKLKQSNNSRRAPIKKKIAGFLQNERSASPDSSISEMCVETTNLLNRLPLNTAAAAAIANDNQLKRKFVSEKRLPNVKTGFVSAKSYMASTGDEAQFKNNPSCEKIIAEAVSNNDKPITSITVQHPKKRFVPKTQSTITQRKQMH